MDAVPPSSPATPQPVENGLAITTGSRPSPATAVERHLVPWEGDQVIFARRCTEADLDPVSGWLDVHLQGDYFFKKRHLRSIIVNPTSAAYAVELAGELIGFVAIYEGSRLHNLYLSAEWRRRGLGAALMKLFNPTQIRAKTNMLAADPTPFYQALGYEVVGQDPKRPWILDLAKKTEVSQMDVRHDAPGTAIAAPREPVTLPAAAAAAVAGGLATSPPIGSTPAKAPPSIGRMTAGQVASIAAKLRAMSDFELAAVGHAAAVNAHWRKRTQAARERRIAREQAEAAALAGQRLDSSLTGETLAKVARAHAEASVADLFGPGAVAAPGHGTNGAPTA